MVKVKKFKFSYPNTGLLFIIAGLAVGNYSYEKYSQQYLNKENSAQVHQKSGQPEPVAYGVPEGFNMVQDVMVDMEPELKRQFDMNMDGANFSKKGNPASNARSFHGRTHSNEYSEKPTNMLADETFANKHYNPDRSKTFTG